MKVNLESVDRENEFFPKGVSGVLKYFCQTCYNSKDASSAFAKYGVTYGKRFELRAAIKRHLQSRARNIFQKPETMWKNYFMSSLPTPLLREKCTENSCLATVLMSRYFLPTFFILSCVFC